MSGIFEITVASASTTAVSEILNDFQTQMQNVHSKLTVNRLWDYYTGERNVNRSLPPYRTTHDKLVVEALKRPPVRPGNYVTDFSSWVFRLYIDNPSNDAAIKGKLAETVIEKKRTAKSQFMSDWTISDWEKDYSGLGDSTEQSLEISSLIVNGRSLRGKPDLVFRHRHTREIVILEIKVSSASVPGGGWPNLRAQLWAYGQIDRYLDAPKIHLACQVWKEKSKDDYELSAPIRIDHSDEEFNKQNERLFGIYGGIIRQ